jgi:hypothetical protein
MFFSVDLEQASRACHREAPLAQGRNGVLRNVLVVAIAISVLAGSLYYITGLANNSPTKSTSNTASGGTTQANGNVSFSFSTKLHTSPTTKTHPTTNSTSNSTNYSPSFSTTLNFTYTTTYNFSTTTTTAFTGMHTHRIVGNFSVGYNPYLFSYDPENKLIYLTEMGGDVVTVINSTNNALISPFP